MCCVRVASPNSAGSTRALPPSGSAILAPAPLAGMSVPTPPTGRALGPAAAHRDLPAARVHLHNLRPSIPPLLLAQRPASHHHLRSERAPGRGIRSERPRTRAARPAAALARAPGGSCDRPHLDALRGFRHGGRFGLQTAPLCPLHGMHVPGRGQSARASGAIWEGSAVYKTLGDRVDYLAPKDAGNCLRRCRGGTVASAALPGTPACAPRP